METYVKDLTLPEFKTLIAVTVRETLEDLQEDLLALGSETYLRSIEEARADVKAGRLVSFAEAFHG